MHKPYVNLSLLTLLFGVLLSLQSFPQSPLSLWYQQPAGNWNEALPVGNGRLGAMVFGRVETERIQLNEESLWAGKRINVNNPGAKEHVREIQDLILKGDHARAYDLSDKHLLATPPAFRSYQTLGDIYIDFGQNGGHRNYRRELDLSTAVATTTYEQGGVLYKREVFASAPTDVIVIRLSSSTPRSINCKLTLAREKDATVTTTSAGSLIMSGQIMDVSDQQNGEGGANMKFSSLVRVMHQEGTVVEANNSMLISGASSVLILMTAATNYDFSKLDLDPAIDTKKKCEDILAKAADNYDELLKQHLAEYQPQFSRMSISLGGDQESSLPTDKRLEAVRKGKEDPALTALYFQYGRYLLLGSSRKPGRLPANLQGIWNEHYFAPWSSDYHTNINVQMNYWPAELTNLSETALPLFDFIDNYRVPGRVTASEMYNAKGWTMHHATDVFGKTGINAGINWGTSPLSAAWLCHHLWEHYLFTGDISFLRTKAYPIIKEAAEFVQSFLISDGKGRLVTAPSMSPENSFKSADGTSHQITYAPTMDVMLVHTLYDACISASAILRIDKPFARSLQAQLRKLPPIQVSKRYGIIQEWIEDYEEAEPGHRHISQLFGLHPAALITENNPELFKAARNTIERRLQHGGGHTGWSRAWIINFYARLFDAEKAHENVVALLQKSTHKNLFDDHPPFQIDGNFGGTAGIAEMLLQSHEGFLRLLPALPKAWSNGSVKGLCARGGFVADMSWKDGKLTECTIVSRIGNELNVRMGEKTFKLKTKAGESYNITRYLR